MLNLIISAVFKQRELFVPVLHHTGQENITTCILYFDNK